MLCYLVTDPDHWSLWRNMVFLVLPTVFCFNFPLFEVNIVIPGFGICICLIIPQPSIFSFSILFCTNVCVCVLSHVRLCNPVDCSPPSSSVHGIFQARILGWGAISFSRGSSHPRDWTHVSCIAWIGRQILYHWCHLGSFVEKGMKNKG